MMDGMGSIVIGFGKVEMWIFLVSGAVLLAFLVWALAGTLGRPRQQPAIVPGTTFEEELHGRLERGEISARDFEDALRQLRDS